MQLINAKEIKVNSNLFYSNDTLIFLTFSNAYKKIFQKNLGPKEIKNMGYQNKG